MERSGVQRSNVYNVNLYERLTFQPSDPQTFQTLKPSKPSNLPTFQPSNPETSPPLTLLLQSRAYPEPAAE